MKSKTAATELQTQRQGFLLTKNAWKLQLQLHQPYFFRNLSQCQRSQLQLLFKTLFPLCI